MSQEIVKPPVVDDATASGAPEAQNDPNTSIFDVPACVSEGTTMTKISKSGNKRVVFRIDPEEGKLIYKSKKNGLVPLEAIKELRTGADAQYYRLEFEHPEEAEERWITIIYILSGEYKTLHILADTRDVFKAWETTLRKIHSVRQGLTMGLGNSETRDAVWERQYWKGADEEGDQLLDFDDVQRMCQRLHANIPATTLYKLFKDAAEGKSALDFAAFQRFVKQLKKRPDIEQIYGRIAGTNGGAFNFEAFEKFSKETQKSKLSSAELKVLFDKYATPVASESANEPSGTLTLDGFTRFLSSSDNTPFAEKGMGVWQDMTRPISEYYISSSHNTYLVGHQLVGVSTIEGYIRALLHSCRSVELDIYDGDDEPVIFHGKTLTSKVSLRDVCVAIKKYGFMTSPYPLLISAEVHCNLQQQEKIVDVMTDVWGDALIQAPPYGRPVLQQLPSPEDLKYKILLKAKNLYIVEQLAQKQAQKQANKQQTLEAYDDSTSESDPDTDVSKSGLSALKNKWRKIRGKETKPIVAKPKVKMSFRLAALLVYTIGVKCHGLTDDVEYAPEHIFSLSENSANKHIKSGMWNLIKHTQLHLVRVYPKGTRMDSSNFEPHRFWASGSQVVAINWQTFDFGYVMNQAMFMRNGRSGYILKPPALRFVDKTLFSKQTKHVLDITVISAQQLPPLRNSKGQEVFGSSIPDPYVEVSLLIPDFLHSPYLSQSAPTAATLSPPGAPANATKLLAARTVVTRTGKVKDNGFNPVWNEELNLPFECVGDMHELIFVNVAIRQAGEDGDSDPALASYCVPLGSLNQGYRHLPLHDSQMNQYMFSTLFVNIAVRDVV